VYACWGGEYRPMQGLLQAVLDAGHCADVLADHQLDEQADRFPVIAVPEWEHLPEAVVEKLAAYAAAAADRGLRVIIAGAGGAAHLPGMLAAQTHLPVLGVPVESSLLRGVDSLLSIVQMPAGVPVGTLAIGPTGAANAALLAVSILALDDAALRGKLLAYRAEQTARVLREELAGESTAWSERPSER